MQAKFCTNNDQISICGPMLCIYRGLKPIVWSQLNHLIKFSKHRTCLPLPLYSTGIITSFVTHISLPECNNHLTIKQTTWKLYCPCLMNLQVCYLLSVVLTNGISDPEWEYVLVHTRFPSLQVSSSPFIHNHVFLDNGSTNFNFLQCTAKASPVTMNVAH
jgi:hypothetical protein